ncbi:hypothetical protein JI739_08710 [Ramlibacter sp. AW1]|uniref:Uncharacterized protein n=1 Tax=Ramlibacter aurantiacus TaxID=2801330 RepID=A0A936ZSP6_9BURK|nr:hypothetical protein [Ramlibacter aurantiacus]MBL0420420.1 hypothetical protein [Ramlibacter aurantiacus]
MNGLPRSSSTSSFEFSWPRYWDNSRRDSVSESTQPSERAEPAEPAEPAGPHDAPIQVRAGPPGLQNAQAAAPVDVEPPEAPRARRCLSLASLGRSLCWGTAVALAGGVQQGISQGVGGAARVAVQTGLEWVASQGFVGAAGAAIGSLLLMSRLTFPAVDRASELITNTVAVCCRRGVPFSSKTVDRVALGVKSLALTSMGAPPVIAWLRDPQQGLALGTMLLVFQMGRTVQNIVRDYTTHTTKYALGGGAEFLIPGEDGQPDIKLKRGDAAYGEVLLQPSTMWLRTGLTLSTYAVGIYLLNKHFARQMEDALDVERSGFGQSDDVAGIARKYAAHAAMSSAIEALDQVTRTYCQVVTAWSRGAETRMAWPERPKSFGELLQRLPVDAYDAWAVRLFNALFSVDIERAVSRLRGVTSNPYMLAGGLAPTDFRGAVIEAGQHHEKRWAATQRTLADEARWQRLQDRVDEAVDELLRPHWRALFAASPPQGADRPRAAVAASPTSLLPSNFSSAASSGQGIGVFDDAERRPFQSAPNFQTLRSGDDKRQRSPSASDEESSRGRAQASRVSESKHGPGMLRIQSAPQGLSAIDATRARQGAVDDGSPVAIPEYGDGADGPSLITFAAGGPAEPSGSLAAQAQPRPSSPSSEELMEDGELLTARDFATSGTDPADPDSGRDSATPVRMHRPETARRH